MKDKKHMNISIDSEKALDKVRHPFIIKTPSKVGVEAVEGVPQHNEGHI